MSNRWLRRIVGCAGMLLLASCGSDEISCPQGQFAAIEVEVRDASTMTPAAQGAAGTIAGRDLIVDLELASPQSDLHLIAFAPPGIYDVHIQRSGYRAWQRSNVLVKHVGCGLTETVFLTALLEPLP